MANESIIINGKALYTTKGAAREYGRIGCNFYTGCPHECSYCYLKRGAPSKQLGSNEVKLKKCFEDEQYAINQFTKELNKWIEPCKKYGIFFSFTTDPLIKETRKSTLGAINMAFISDVPVFILTKNADFVNDDSFMVWLMCFSSSYKHLVNFGFTLTGRDDLEPKASKNIDRIKAMQKLHNMGFPTFASIEPVIDWQSTENIVNDAMLWCDHFKLGLRSGVRKDYYNMQESIGAICRIVDMCNKNDKTIYLKESTRKLLKEGLRSESYERLLSLTVDMDGKRIEL